MKFWVPKLQKEEGANNSKVCFIANFRSWEHVHTHTQGLIVVQDLYQVMQPHIHLFSLYMGFEVNIWAVHSYVFLACIHVVSCPCNNFGKRRFFLKKKDQIEEKNYLFSFTCHWCAIEFADMITLQCHR